LHLCAGDDAHKTNGSAKPGAGGDDAEVSIRDSFTRGKSN